MRSPIKVLLLLMLSAICLRCDALTIYEIRYEFKGLSEFPSYTAMLVRYGNGTGFMRVRYTNKSGTDVYVVNMEFEEEDGSINLRGNYSDYFWDL